MKVTVFFKFRKLQWARHVNKNGGISYNKESCATNTSHQQKVRKTQKKMGRCSERGCHHVTLHACWEN